jgi:YfiH family protein
MKVTFSENLNGGRFETRSSQPEILFHHAHQVHGTEIASIETLPCQADGLMVSWESFDKPLAIKTADCLPIVIEGGKGVIFLHVGWRGLAQGILKKPEIQMIEPQRVFIGPSIHECCFEVSEDFRDNFPDSPYFKQIDNKYYFNLQEEAKRQLRELFPVLLIEIAPLCTCCDETLHSYRRDKTSERNWNLYIKG